MELREFKQMIQKRKGSKWKVNNSFGSYDIYKLMRKRNWYNIGRPLKEHEYYTIIKNINMLLAKEIADGNTVVFPAKMGKLELRKYEAGVSIVDGKLKNTYPIDWNKTLNLWFEDEEARKNKTLLRNEQKWVYHVKYCNHDATYENKSFYQFALNIYIRKNLSKNIKEGKTDALW